MRGINQFLKAQKEWRYRSRTETAWNREREEILNLYIKGQEETFFVLAIDDLPLWSSFFTYVPFYGVKFGLFGSPSDPLATRLFWESVFNIGLEIPWANTTIYDAGILAAFGDVNIHQKSADVIDVLTNLALSQVPIATPSGKISVCRYEASQILLLRQYNQNSWPKGATLPINKVSWFQALEICNNLSSMHNLQPCYDLEYRMSLSPSYNSPPPIVGATWNRDANGYRLLTEAEWIYCARANEDTQFPGSDNVDEVAWHDENSDTKMHPVGQKRPNAFGLYDMGGNVSEWLWSPEIKMGLARMRKHAGGSFDATASWNNLEYIEEYGNSAIAQSAPFNDIGFRICRNL